MPATLRTLTASLGGKNYPVTGLHINLTVNQTALVDVEALPPGEQVVEVTAASVLSEVKRANRELSSGKKAPDFQLTAAVDGAGSFSFLGYDVAPRFTVNKQGAVSFKLRGVGVDAILDNLNLGIYRHSGATADPETSSDLKPIPKETQGSIHTMLQNCTQVLVSNFPQVEGATYPARMRALLNHQHSLNLGPPLDAWYAILGNSNVVFEKWAALAAKHPHIASMISEKATKLMQQSVSGFWSLLNGLMESFFMYYVPNPTGHGKLVRLDEKTKNPIPLGEFSPTSADFIEGDRKLVPLGGVVMIAPGPATADKETVGSKSVAGEWPQPLLPGYIYQTTPPVWLVDTSGVPVIGSVVDTTPVKPAPDYTLGKYLGTLKGAEDFKVDLSKKAISFLDELCQIIYLDKVYQSSQASFTLPLDFRLPYGVRVSGSFGGQSFEGFVESVDHHVRVDNGKTLLAQSTLTLTHMTY